MSYGPCQTPTLGFVVRREDEIATFEAEPYWFPEVACDLGEAAPTRLAWARRRCFDHPVAAALCRAIADRGAGVVRAAEAVSRRRAPPLAMNTVELLKAASRVLRLSPAQAMRHAERLYLDGFLSYPRTETTRFPESMDVVGAVLFQVDDERWGAYAADLVARKAVRRPRRGVDAGDHPPITPTAPAPPGTLAGPAARLYDLVARRFLAAVGDDATYAAQKLDIEHAATGERFSFDREVLTEAGFLAVLRPERVAEAMAAELLPALPRVGDALRLACAAAPREASTTAPDRLTEADCVALMEKHGIGTDASIPSHIENVCKRAYVRVDEGSRRLRPTDLGVVVCRGSARRRRRRTSIRILRRRTYLEEL